jgi:hypothetical protein
MERFYGWVGLALPKKMKPPKPRPSPPPSKTALGVEKLASESHAGTSSFFQFFTRFLYGEVASQSPKNTFWELNFLFCAKVVLEHFGTTWRILHRTSTKKYRQIEVSPMALWALHFFGNARPTQPYSTVPPWACGAGVVCFWFLVSGARGRGQQQKTATAGDVGRSWPALVPLSGARDARCAVFFPLLLLKIINY